MVTAIGGSIDKEPVCEGYPSDKKSLAFIGRFVLYTGQNSHDISTSFFILVGIYIQVGHYIEVAFIYSMGGLFYMLVKQSGAFYPLFYLHVGLYTGICLFRWLLMAGLNVNVLYMYVST